jgi:hypothetical protein
MRFNAPEYLEDWKNGKYPNIHKIMFNAVKLYGQGNNILDLCCSTGLLGTQIAEKLNKTVVGIESSPASIDLAAQYGVPIPIQQMKLTRETLEPFVTFCNLYNVDTIVARRCVPELFSEDYHFGLEFVAAIKAIGVKEVFLEGRVKTSTATNIFNSIDLEIDLFTTYDMYKVTKRLGNIGYLTISEAK